MTTPPVILFFKSHVDTFTRKDGTVVQAHDDKRVAAPKKAKRDPKMIAHERAEASTVRKFGTTAGHEAENHYKKTYLGHMEILTGKKPGDDGERTDPKTEQAKKTVRDQDYLPWSDVKDAKEKLGQKDEGEDEWLKKYRNRHNAPDKAAAAKELLDEQAKKA